MFGVSGDARRRFNRRLNSLAGRGTVDGGARQRLSWPRRLGSLGAGLAVVVAGVVTLAPPASAASASITFSPSTGPWNSPVIFSGSSWLPYDSVNIEFETSGTPVKACTIIANSAGAIGPESCLVPSGLPAGDYTVEASDGTTTATGSFSVDPGLVVMTQPASGSPAPTTEVAPGQTVELTGNDFSAGASISATFNKSSLALTPATPTTTSTGSLPTGVTFTVPTSTPAGLATLSVTDSATYEASLGLTVYDPSITSPTDGASGAPVEFSGTNWPPNDTVSLWLVAPSGSATAMGCTNGLTTDSTGTISATSCLVPTSVPAGSYTINATDGSVSINGPTFEVDPSITLWGGNEGEASETDAAPGQMVQILGTGFSPSEALSATFNGDGLTLISNGTGVETTATGTFSSAFEVPPSATAGFGQTVSVTDGGEPATADLAIFTPTIAITPGSAASGAPVSIQGSGWPGNDLISVKLMSPGGSTLTTVCNVTSQPNGAVLATAGSANLITPCDVPTTVPYGTYNVVAADSCPGGTTDTGNCIDMTSTSQFTVQPGITLYGAAWVDFGASTPDPTATAAPGQVLAISGTGFSPDSTLSLTVDGAPVPLSGSASTDGSGTTLSDGQVNYPPTASNPTELSFVVPQVNGPVQVALTDSNNDVATYELDVYNASIAAAATGGDAGTQMAFTGNGWPDGDAVTIKLGVSGSTNPTIVCTVNADSTGRISSQSCPLPTSDPYGSYNLIASDNSIAVDAASPFTMQPGLTLDAQTLTATYTPTATAAVGQVVYISAAGFEADSILTVTFNGEAVGWTTQPKTSGLGSVSPYAYTSEPAPGFTVQPVPSGWYTVTVTDQYLDSINFSLYVYNATIMHTPTAGVSGDPFTLSGSGWPGNDTIQIRLVPQETSPLNPPTSTICSINSDSTGTVAGQTCTVPTTLPMGDYEVYAADDDENLAVYGSPTTPGGPSSFQMLPSITVTGASGNTVDSAYPGEEVNLSGTGFDTGTSLTTASFGSSTVYLLPVPTITATGSFTGTSFVIPSGTTGPVTLSVTNNGETATYVLDVYQPSFTYSPSSAAAGTTMTLSGGSGWPANDTIKMELGTVTGSTFTDKSIMCSVTTTSSGTITPQTCPVPSTIPAGSYTLVATDGSLLVTAPSPFALGPTAETVTSTDTGLGSAAPGATVYLNGWGFAANSTITNVTIDGQNVSLSAEANGNGSFSEEPFTVPSTMAAGTYTMTVTDASSDIATLYFTVT